MKLSPPIFWNLVLNINGAYAKKVAAYVERKAQTKMQFNLIQKEIFTE